MAKVTIDLSAAGFLMLMALSSRLGLPAKDIMSVAVEISLRSLQDIDVMAFKVNEQFKSMAAH